MTDSDVFVEYHRRMVANLPSSPTNAKLQYEREAQRHQLPDQLIERLAEEYKDRLFVFSHFEKVARTTNASFWKAANSACNENLGHLIALHFVLLSAGGDVYQGRKTEFEKNKKQELIDSIDGLKSLLMDYNHRDTKHLGILTLLGFAPSECKALDPNKLNAQKRQNETVRNAHAAIIDSSLTDREEKAYRLIKICSTPSPYDLLDCLKAAVKKDFQPNYNEHVVDTRARPRYNPRAPREAQIKWMLQELIEWFLQFSDKTPKSEIIHVITETASQRLNIPVSKQKIDGFYRSAGKKARERDRMTLKP